MTRVSVIVPFFNRQPDLEAQLDSFTKLYLDGIRLEFIIVEDGCHVDDKEALARRHASLGLRFLSNPINRGPGYCRNMAAKNALGTYLWFLDSDTEILRADTLRAMITVLETQKDCLATGGSLEKVGESMKIMMPVRLPNFQFVYRVLTPDDTYGAQVLFLSTCNMFISKERFIQAGGFDTDLKMYEDNEICLRLLQINQGGTFYQSIETMVYHTVSSRGRDGGTFNYFNNHMKYMRTSLHTRNILLYRYDRRLMAVLPAADILAVVVITRGVLAGRWNLLSRITKIKAKTGTRLFSIVSTLLIIAFHQMEAWWMIATFRDAPARLDTTAG